MTTLRSAGGAKTLACMLLELDLEPLRVVVFWLFIVAMAIGPMTEFLSLALASPSPEALKVCSLLTILSTAAKFVVAGTCACVLPPPSRFSPL
jgi:hypothetical protein